MMPFISTGISIAAFAGAGLLLGLAYFATLWRTVALLVDGSSWLAPAALTLGRMGGLALFLGISVRLGALDLIAAFIGVVVARLVALHVVRRAA